MGGLLALSRSWLVCLELYLLRVGVFLRMVYQDLVVMMVLMVMALVLSLVHLYRRTIVCCILGNAFEFPFSCPSFVMVLGIAEIAARPCF